MSRKCGRCLLLYACCALLGCSDAPAVKPPQSRPAPKVDLNSLTFSDSTPESALREFLVARMARDADRLSRITVPHPDARILTEGEPFPRQEIEMMSGALPHMSFERLHVGQWVSHADGSMHRIDRKRVHASRVELVTPFHPEPFVLVKTDDGWRVDPARLIGKDAGRHAPADDGPVEAPKP